MEEYVYLTLTRKSEEFKKICDYLDKKIVDENLYRNGGTLNYSGLVYESDILIVCFKDNVPVGFNSVIELPEGYYIYQIAVSKEEKKKGIGKQLMQMIMDRAAANNKDIAAHVRDYNTASQKLFESLGFKVEIPGPNMLFILRGKKYTPSK